MVTQQRYNQGHSQARMHANFKDMSFLAPACRISRQKCPEAFKIPLTVPSVILHSSTNEYLVMQRERTQEYKWGLSENKMCATSVGFMAVLTFGNDINIQEGSFLTLHHILTIHYQQKRYFSLCRRCWLWITEKRKWLKRNRAGRTRVDSPPLFLEDTTVRRSLRDPSRKLWGSGEERRVMEQENLPWGRRHCGDPSDQVNCRQTSTQGGGFMAQPGNK